MANRNILAGFTTVELLFTLVVLVIVGGAGYVLYKSHQNAKTTQSTASAKSPTNNSGTNNTTAPPASPNPPNANFTGIYGTVTNGGCAGPISTDASKNHCTRQPQANMLVSAIGTNVNATGNAMTDSNGNYRLVIAPGTYAVSTHAARENIIAECKGPVSVTVKKGIATKQNFDCDNGLR